jgi:5-methylcytosine-specific restriction enzyme subunit McrC
MNLYLDAVRAIRLEPDISWWDGKRCLFVGDVKYKQINVAGILHPDLYQLLAYTIATGLPDGLLIYASGEDKPVIHEVLQASKRLHVTTVDLRGAPDDILAQVRNIATSIRRLTFDSHVDSHAYNF